MNNDIHADDQDQQDIEDAFRPDHGGMFVPTEQEHLAEDNDTPAAPADDTSSNIQIDHPAIDNATDTEVHELYDEGLYGASGIGDQHGDAGMPQ